MSSLNRQERQTLRNIQAHLEASLLESGTIVEQLGTVDVYFHPTNPDPYLNCATPHRGVAWVRRDDLISAFAGLERLGRVPRLNFQDALFPEAFRQQIELMGLTLEDQRGVMLYRPVYGPSLPDETMLGRLPNAIPYPITTVVATSRPDLALWLRVFRAGYFNTETLTVEPEAIDALEKEVMEGNRIFVLAYYEETALGAARIGIRSPTAELEAVVTAPLWHGMGLELGLTITGVREALKHGCQTAFTIAPPETFWNFYRRLGFVTLTHVLTFWQAEEYDDPQAASDPPDSGDTSS